MAPLPGVPPDIALMCVCSFCLSVRVCVANHVALWQQTRPFGSSQTPSRALLTLTAGHLVLSGVQLLGYLFGYGLFGVLVVQMCMPPVALFFS